MGLIVVLKLRTDDGFKMSKQYLIQGSSLKIMQIMKELDKNISDVVRQVNQAVQK